MVLTLHYCQPLAKRGGMTAMPPSGAHRSAAAAFSRAAGEANRPSGRRRGFFHNLRYNQGELTNNETLTFTEMADQLSQGLGKKINYFSPNLLHFYFSKRQENMPTMLILVMIMLHYLPRFQKTPEMTKWVKILTGHEPQSFDEFASLNRQQLT